MSECFRGKRSPHNHQGQQNKSVRPASVLGLGKPEGNFPRVTAHFKEAKTKELRDGATSNVLKGAEHLRFDDQIRRCSSVISISLSSCQFAVPGGKRRDLPPAKAPQPPWPRGAGDFLRRVPLRGGPRGERKSGTAGRRLQSPTCTSRDRNAGGSGAQLRVANSHQLAARPQTEPSAQWGNVTTPGRRPGCQGNFRFRGTAGSCFRPTRDFWEALIGCL